MFAVVGYSIGRTSDTARNLPPSRLALSVPAIGGNAPASLERQIAMTADGSAVVFITGSESGGDALAVQRLDEGAARFIDGAPAELGSDIVARDGSSVRNSSLFSRLRPNDRDNPGAASMAGARFQQMLPDGRNALALRAPGGTAAGTAVVRDTETGTEKRILNDPVVEMRYAAGHIVYARGDGTLWAVPFDSEQLEATSSPVRIGQGVSLTGSGIAQFAVARNGNVAYVAEEPRWLVLVDRNGRLRNATRERASYRSPRFSPDGKRVSVDFTGTDGRDIWILTRQSGSLSRATFTRDAHDAEWVPDGSRITFTSFISGSLGIFRAVPGDAKPDSIFASPQLAYTGRWLRDGSGLLTVAENIEAASQLDVAFLPNEGRGPLEPVIVDGSRAQQPVISPDGQWLAYVSNRTGIDQVYVRPWRREGSELAVSRSGGTEPVWSPDGRELFYRGSNGRYPILIAAAVASGEEFRIVDRIALFPIGDIAAATPQANYDVSPDGRTFVMVRLAQASRITVLQNLPGLMERAKR